MLFLFLLRGKDGFKGLFFSGQLLLNSAMAAMIAGNRWRESALVLRKCTGFGHNGATLLFMASNTKVRWGEKIH